MLPTKSNLSTQGCTPTSSNCVIWQGPDLQCINLCTGDTVTDVVNKIAAELCTIQDSLGVDLSDVDFKCLLPNTGGQIAAGSEITDALQLLIDQTCLLTTAVDEIQDNLDVTVTAPSCLNLRDANGDNLTNISLEDFALLLAQKICNLESDSQDIQTQLAQNTIVVEDLNERVEDLENAGKLQVVTQCTSFGGSTTKSIDDAYEDLETAFCNIRSTLGDSTELIQAIDNECPGVGSPSAVYSLVDNTVPLWLGTSNNVADTLTHMWKAICDLRGAVRTIQENCCKVNINDIIVDFDVRPTQDRTGLSLFFAEKTFIPGDFYDVDPRGNKLTITDSLGNKFTHWVRLRTPEGSETTGVLDNVGYLSEGYPIDLTVSAISPTASWDLVMDAVITNGDSTVARCVRDSSPYVETSVDNCCTITGEGSGTAIIIYEL